MTAAQSLDALKRRVANRTRYERDKAAYATAAREQREELLIVGRPAWEWGVGLLPVDYGIAELVRREKGGRGVSARLADEMLIRWRRLAQVDVSTMQADTAVTELSRAVLLLLDEDLELRAQNQKLATGARDAMELVVNLRMERDLLKKALKYAGDTNTNLTKLLRSFAPELAEQEPQP
jgi:hypothetical protein